ncbi:hypothetical protein NQ314_007993 [Rhamnusium bicolor]|uniref:BUD13 homolog n=1 Tax=Rhamnusium bicolor TaxID=1586634 RepID=A0AAV8YFQ3_9CUCU|nr:hypothetical protein NQ314_007993 [Rhamnusium bicolor]
MFSPRVTIREEKSSKKKEDKEENPSRSKSRTTDKSPPRKKDKVEHNSPSRNISHDEDVSPPRMRIRTGGSGISPKKNRQADSKQKKSRWGNWSTEAYPEKTGRSDEKMTKTLDGKKAGLQNAKDLVTETIVLRHREDEIFKNMSAEVSGVNAATIVRGKKVRDLEEEARQKDTEKKTKEKYDRWGKGLKQVVDQNERIAEQLHEMSKPLARYADDDDLEKYLKEKEREGDPMLAYIRKKKKKRVEKPVYMGEFMPNRFGIHPGYRWDGVDRSNGYEKKWFQVQNSKKATQEEAFKWSTEDM